MSTSMPRADRSLVLLLCLSFGFGFLLNIGLLLGAETASAQSDRTGTTTVLAPESLCSYPVFPVNCTAFPQLAMPPTRWDLNCSNKKIVWDPVMHSFNHSSDWHNAMLGAVANWNNATSHNFFVETGSGPNQIKGQPGDVYEDKYGEINSAITRRKTSDRTQGDPPCPWVAITKDKMYINLGWTWQFSGCTFSPDPANKTGVGTAISTLTHEFGHWLRFQEAPCANDR